MPETHSEGSPWFWKIFGGTIFGMITLLLVTIFGNLRNETSDNKREFLSQINEMRSDIRQDRDSFNGFKERIFSLEQAFSKDKIQNLAESINTQKERLFALEQVSSKDKIQILTESINSQKEKFAALEAGIAINNESIKGIREEIKTINSQKEKLAALEAGLLTNNESMKAIRDEIKDLTKQIQEAREKVAALTPVVSEVKNPTTVK
jgi:chromosome segregation ATPase